MPRTLEHISIVIRDYDEAIAFYTDVLDFTLVEDSYQAEQNKRWVIVQPCGGGASLLLARASTPEQERFIGQQTGGRVFLFLRTHEFWSDYYKLKDREVRFVREPTEAEYGFVAVFEDLYGNLWDLVEFTDGRP